MRRFTRRTPPLLMGVVALALMLSIFPSALHIPLNGPGGAAEIAPIPGQGREQANLSAGGAASSEGVGSGGGATAGGAAPSSSPGPGLGGGSAPDCVGDPARQTADPLSPPCRSVLWTGDNGGATAPGVTGGAINVVVFGALATGVNDTTEPTSGSESPVRHTLKVLLKFFNSRFALYGRQVVLKQVNVDTGTGACGSPNSCASAAEDQFPGSGTFAGISIALNPSPPLDTALSQRHVFSFSGWNAASNYLGDGYSRALLQSTAPYVHPFLPDSDTEAEMTAQWICAEMEGNRAVHSPTYSTRQRKFGILYDTTGSYFQQDSQLLAADLKESCGETLGNGRDIVGANSQQQSSYLNAIAALQGDNVTSVIFESGAPVTNYAFGTADKAAYFPEWLFNFDTPASEPATARTADQSQWADAVGITWRWRMQASPGPYWDRAYDEMATDGMIDTYFAPDIYEQLLRLYSGIQMAGPDLNPTTFERGLESYQRFATADHYSPSAWFAPGDWTYVKGMMIVRWNPTMQPPGGVTTTGGSSGCFMDMNGGARYDAGQWPAGDQTTGSGPCDADWEGGGDSDVDAQDETGSTQQH